MKASIMRSTNQLLSLLDNCRDEALIDEVCLRVSSNDPFDDDAIEEAEKMEG